MTGKTTSSRRVRFAGWRCGFSISQDTGSGAGGTGSGVGSGFGSGVGPGTGVVDGVGAAGEEGGLIKSLNHWIERFARSRIASTAGRSPWHWWNPQAAPPTSPRRVRAKKNRRIRRRRFHAFSLRLVFALGGGEGRAGAVGSETGAAPAAGSGGTTKPPPHSGHAISCSAHAASASSSW